MALTRAMLKGMDKLTEEEVNTIINAHRETVDGLKEERDALKTERDQYKADAEKLPVVQKELDDMKKDGGDWQKKYEDEHKAFDDFKKNVEDEKNAAVLKDAYKKLLSESKVGEKHIDSILRVTDFSKMKLDKDGKLVDADKLTESIKADWSGFIATESEKGAKPETPPSGDGKTPTHVGRAAELAKQYHESLYGAVEKKE